MHLAEGVGPLLKDGFEQLASPVRGLPELQHQVCKLLTGKTKKISFGSLGGAVI
jgi:hypothetical protein